MVDLHGRTDFYQLLNHAVQYGQAQWHITEKGSCGKSGLFPGRYQDCLTNKHAFLHASKGFSESKTKEMCNHTLKLFLCAQFQPGLEQACPYKTSFLSLWLPNFSIISLPTIKARPFLQIGVITIQPLSPT